ncbi:trichohyalin-like isoform X1 [Colias croceus]|uniref:trichohyalin-like isoform X1 n=2 Tax=Colias crocea TaxID=72248 RepID=UPI001E27AC70|nr:trichohyalin-like isoform X1 [Colias croceus]
MDKTPASIVETFIGNWNGAFPNHPLTAADLKVPHSVMGALFEVFARLGIDRDAVLSPPDEEHNENTVYYWDLIPMINMTRVINHLVSIMPQVDAKISISHFLQPTVTTSQSILLLLFNLMIFNEERLSDIKPQEEELFSKSKEVNKLEQRKNKLLELLNVQAEEKGKRAERIEEFHEQIKLFEEESKQENEALKVEKSELDVVLKENHQLELIIDQKKTQKEALTDEIEKKKALIVYDADDIKAQAAKAAQDVQDADEKLNALMATLALKENNLKNLQAIKPNFDVANHYLNEIMKIVDSLKDYENGDLDSDSVEGELNVLNTEISELESQYAELKVAREEASKKHQENQAKRQREKALAERNINEAEKRDKKCQEQLKKSTQAINSIKERTRKYDEEKNSCLEQLSDIKDDFQNKVKHAQDSLLMVLSNAEKEIAQKCLKLNKNN